MRTPPAQMEPIHRWETPPENADGENTTGRAAIASGKSDNFTARALEDWVNCAQLNADAPCLEANTAHFACQKCGKPYDWKPELVGKVARCACGAVLKIPSAQPGTAANQEAVYKEPNPG